MERSSINRTHPVLLLDLNIKNYVSKFLELLCLEENEVKTSYAKFDAKGVEFRHIPGVTFVNKNRSSYKYSAKIEKIPKRLQCDDLMVIDDSIFGTIEKINAEHNHHIIEVWIESKSIIRKRTVNIKFVYNSFVYDMCREAVGNATIELGNKILFPKVKDEVEKCRQNMARLGNPNGAEDIYWFNDNLNAVQKQAVTNIIEGRMKPMPYVIYGPPGTGKTVTLVETILQIVKRQPCSKLLIAAPSNSAADLLAERLIKSGMFETDKLVRLISNDRLKKLKIDTSLKKFYSESRNVKNCTITIGTCVILSVLRDKGWKNYTHVLVDESGQCIEPEIMAVLSLVDRRRGQIILAGDPKQLGPVVNSSLALKHGLGTSFLERLLNCAPYKRNPLNDQFDPRLVTQLTYNFRSIPQIVSLFNDTFYDGKLLASADVEALTAEKRFQDIQRCIDRSMTQNPGTIFYGIASTNLKNVDTCSWHNYNEAYKIVAILSKLYRRGVRSDDVGIITPYSSQVDLIQKLLNKNSIKHVPMIGSVDMFQGQERKIILMSTVRTLNKNNMNNVQNQLGFVKSPNRINVAVSRAEILLVIVGDPRLLVYDANWQKILLKIREVNGYIGHWPKILPNFDKTSKSKKKYSKYRMRHTKK